MTTATITDILILSREAAEAGDIDQVMLCDLALGGPEALAGAEPGTAAAELLARGTTQDEARQMCLDVIETARAADHMTREQAIEMLVSMDVARWGEEERAESMRVHARRSLGLALNELANRVEMDLTGGVEVGHTVRELRAQAKAAMTASDRATLRQGG